MPTLQAVDLNHFETVAETSAELQRSSNFAGAAGQTHGIRQASRLRGYIALGSFFMITGIGYAGLLLIFDHLVVLAKG